MIPLFIAGTQYHLQPTYAGLCEIEHRTGHNIMAIARKVAGHDLGIAELVTILECSMKETPPDDLGEALVHGEMGKAIDAVAAMMLHILGETTEDVPSLTRKEVEQLYRLFPDITAVAGVAGTTR